MANWKHKIEGFGPLLTQLSDDEAMADSEKATKLADCIEQGAQTAPNEEIKLHLKEIAQQIRICDNEEEINEIVTELYNYGDAGHRVWLGLP